MTDLQSPLSYQTSPSLPEAPGREQSTDLLLVSSRAADRLRHFPEETYRLTPESHLVRFAKVLLGDSGTGQLRKKYTLARLQQTIQGSHFFDLDRFYGALFGIQRHVSEVLTIDPYTGTATADQWADLMARDASYRSRIIQFSRAIAYGASPIGMELVAEALLTVDVDIYESFKDVDAGAPGITNRRLFTVRPKRPITLEEHYDVLRVLARLKPADAIAYVDANGVALHSPISLRGVAADSEHWEIISRVTPRTVTTELPYPVIDVDSAEQPRPPFSGYQGEAWTYNGDLQGALAYYRYAGSSDIPSPLQRMTYPAQSVYVQPQWGVGGFTPGHSYTPDPTIIEYGPEKALASKRSILAGRYISDAIYQAHPYGDRDTGTADIYVTDSGQVFALLDSGQTVRLSVQYADKIPVEGLLDALASVPNAQSDPNATSGPQHFWLSPPRQIENRSTEVLETRLASPRTLNYISFETAHFPHTISIEVYDEDALVWKSVGTHTVSDSFPRTVPKDAPPGSTTHPQHPDVSDHWVKVSKKIDPVRASRVRLMMTRSDGTPPKIIETGYSGGGSALVNGPVRESFSSSGELYQAQSYLEGHDLAAPGQSTYETNLWRVSGYTSFQDDTNGTYWIEYNAPHMEYYPPVAYSYEVPVAYGLAVRNLDIGYRVESFYDVPLVPATTTDMLGSNVEFDLRHDAAAGLMLPTPEQWRCEPQPLSQAVINLFADTRDVAGEAQIIDRFYLDPIDPGPAFNLYWSNDTPSGIFPADEDDLVFPIVETAGTITADGTGLIFDDTASAYITVDGRAIQFDPDLFWWVGLQLRSLLPSASATVRVLFDFDAVRCEVSDDEVRFYGPNGQVATQPLAFGANTLVTLLFSYDDGNVAWRITAGMTVVEGSASWAPYDAAVPPLVRIGAPLTGTANPPGFTLRSFVLKQGAVTDGSWETFEADPITYAKTPGRGRLTGRSTDNALLRYAPNRVSADNPLGIVGGPGYFYEGLVWHPIARDYVLQKGFIHLPPTKAKFWKFEFTNLVAEPYESFLPITRTVKLFPEGTRKETMWQQTNGAYDTGVPGQRAAVDLGDRLFVDNYIDASLPERLYSSPTAAQFSTNIAEQDRLRNESWAFGFQPWHLGENAPSFSSVGLHRYEQIEVKHSSKVGFFVGLRALEAYRVDYNADDDSLQYVEHFGDFLNIQPGFTWQLDPYRLHNEALTTAEARSIVFQSAHDVVGVQFATQQTHATQIIYDDDFMDPALANYDFRNLDYWNAIGDASISYSANDHSVVINRVPSTDPPPVLEEQHPVGLVDELPHPVFSRDYLTAEESAAYASANGGVASAIAAPSAEGMFYAAVRFTALTNIVAAAPYYLQIINANDDSVIIEKPITAKANEVVEDYLAYEIGTLAPATTPVRVAMVQRTKQTSAIKIDTLSGFDQGIVWDFSVDGGTTWVRARGTVRNNARGVITFPTPGNQLVWRVRGVRPNMEVNSLQIRPIYEGQRQARPSGVLRGPNVSTYDHFPPIAEDPEFQAWHHPVPYWWWREARRYPNLPIEGQPIVTQFQRFYGRPAEDALDAPTDAATRSLYEPRSPGDGAPAVDSATRNGVFKRTASDSAPVSGQSADGTKTRSPSMVKPLPHDTP